MRRYVGAAIVVLVALLAVAVTSVFATGYTNYTDTGYGYSWGESFTPSVSCSVYYCAHGKTYNYNYSYSPTTAYYLQAASAGWNCDLYCHCVDWEDNIVTYSNYVTTGPDAYTWDSTQGGPPTMWISSVHEDIPQYGASDTETFSSSDSSHNGSSWTYGASGC